MNFLKLFDIFEKDLQSKLLDIILCMNKFLYEPSSLEKRSIKLMQLFYVNESVKIFIIYKIANFNTSNLQTR